MEKRERYYLLDGLRGIAVLSMVIYHFVWDLNYVAGFRWGSYSSPFNFIWQQSICWIFILLSGFCFHFARHPLKNGLFALLGGVAVCLVTVILTPDSAIYFGVLIFHGSAMLLLLPIRKLLYKVPVWLGAAVSLLLFIISYNVNKRSLFFGLINLPKLLYANFFTAYLGFPPNNFISADYFPLIPWLFLFLTGFFLSGMIKNMKTKPKFLYFRLPVFEWIGRHALIIYLAHQPILYGITLLIIKIQGA